MKAGNTKNLRPFRKGHDPRRNTKGQPPKLPELDQLLAKCMQGHWESMINAIIRKAKRGDVRACQLLLDRAFGRSRQTIEATLTPIINIESADPETKKIVEELRAKMAEIDREFEQNQARGDADPTK